jgi:hypothetical protein
LRREYVDVLSSVGQLGPVESCSDNAVLNCSVDVSMETEFPARVKYADKVAVADAA